MAYQFAAATFYLPGDATADRIRDALSLLECRYNLTAWLYVDREFEEWQPLTEYFAAVLAEAHYPPLPIARRMSQRLSELGSRRRRRGVERGGVGLALRLNEIFIEGIPSLELQLHIRGVYPSASVNVDTSGLGEPMKEVVKGIWSRKERQEARRHTEEINWRKERELDQDFERRRRNDLYDDIERVHHLRSIGAISDDFAAMLMRDLIPVQQQVESTLRAEQIDYVDDSHIELES